MELVEVLTDPTGVELWRASDTELQSFVAGLSTRVSVVEAVRLRVVAELDRRGTAIAAGASSTGRLVAGLVHAAPGVGARWVELALWLERSPEVAAALGCGAITTEHARVVMATMGALPTDLPDDGRDACRDYLLDVATGDDPVVLRRRATELLHLVTPEDTELVEERARQRRELRISSTPVDGLVSLRGRLDVDAAELLRSTLSPLATPRPATDGTPDRRTPAHRMADALVELVGLAADHACVPGEGYTRPHITLTVDADTLATGTGPLATVPFLGALSAAAARRWACDAEITPISLDTTLVPLDVGRTTYVVTGGLRKAGDRPRRRVLVPRVRAPTSVVPRPPHPTLGRRRSHRPDQPDDALRPPPPGHPPPRLARHHRRRRTPLVHPTTLDRPHRPPPPRPHPTTPPTRTPRPPPRAPLRRRRVRAGVGQLVGVG